MSRTVVVGAAPCEGFEPFYRRLLSTAHLVVAADAAAEWCVGLGRVPDTAVGDFDSADPGAVERLSGLGVEVLTFPRDKDETDLERAVDAARERSSDPIVLSAAFSRRLDHTLAAFGALVRAGAGATVSEPEWRAALCVPGTVLTLDLQEGTALSLIALTVAEGLTVSGTKWTLEAARLSSLSGRGVSNCASGGPVRVSTTSGSVVVILPNCTDSGLY
jgi:thiamine pyrophosphokinase